MEFCSCRHLFLLVSGGFIPAPHHAREREGIRRRRNSSRVRRLAEGRARGAVEVPGEPWREAARDRPGEALEHHGDTTAEIISDERVPGRD